MAYNNNTNNSKDKSSSDVGLNNKEALDRVDKNEEKTIDAHKFNKNSSSDKKDNDSHKDSSDSHKSSHHKHVSGKHSFIHPEQINKDNFDSNEQKVKCDCGQQVPVSQINRDVESTTGVIAQQGQNANNTNSSATTIVDQNKSGNTQAHSLSVDTTTSPPTVYEDGIKSNANLYAHDQRVQDAIHGNVKTKTVEIDTSKSEHQVNKLGTSPSERIAEEAAASNKKSKKD